MVRLLSQGADINGTDKVRLVTHGTTSLGTCRIKVTHIYVLVINKMMVWG